MNILIIMLFLCLLLKVNVLNVACSNDPINHAEINAVKKLKFTNKKMNLLVVRVSKTGVLGDSRPCHHCLLSLLKLNLNIKYIYYSTNEGLIKRERFNKMLNDNIHISKGNRVNNLI